MKIARPTEAEFLAMIQSTEAGKGYVSASFGPSGVFNAVVRDMETGEETEPTPDQTLQP